MIDSQVSGYIYFMSSSCDTLCWFDSVHSKKTLLSIENNEERCFLRVTRRKSPHESACCRGSQNVWKRPDDEPALACAGPASIRDQMFAGSCSHHVDACMIWFIRPRYVGQTVEASVLSARAEFETRGHWGLVGNLDFCNVLFHPIRPNFSQSCDNHVIYLTWWRRQCFSSCDRSLPSSLSLLFLSFSSLPPSSSSSSSSLSSLSSTDPTSSSAEAIAEGQKHWKDSKIVKHYNMFDDNGQITFHDTCMRNDSKL